MRDFAILACFWAIFRLNVWAFGLQNITVDDGDPSIQYSSGWTVSDTSSPLDYGGFHHLSDQPSATASFAFTGVAIYLMSPLWPYAVAAQIALDSFPPSIVALEDFSHTTDGGPETVNTSVVWSQTGLVNGTHNLTVSFAPGSLYVALDALIYTVQDSDMTTSLSSFPTTDSSSLTTTSSTATITSSSSSNSSSTSSSSSSSHILPIALGTSLGVVGLALLIVALFLICRRRDEGNSFYSNAYSDTRPPVSFVGGRETSVLNQPFSSRTPSEYIVEPYGGTAAGHGGGHGTMTYPDHPQAAPFPHRYTLTDNPVPPPDTPGKGASTTNSYAAGASINTYEEYNQSSRNDSSRDISSVRGSASLAPSQNNAGVGSGQRPSRRVRVPPVQSASASAPRSTGGVSTASASVNAGTPRSMLKADFVRRSDENPPTYR